MLLFTIWTETAETTSTYSFLLSTHNAKHSTLGRMLHASCTRFHWHDIRHTKDQTTITVIYYKTLWWVGASTHRSTSSLSSLSFVFPTTSNFSSRNAEHLIYSTLIVFIYLTSAKKKTILFPCAISFRFIPTHDTMECFSDFSLWRRENLENTMRFLSNDCA